MALICLSMSLLIGKDRSLDSCELIGLCEVVGISQAQDYLCSADSVDALVQVWGIDSGMWRIHEGPQ